VAKSFRSASAFKASLETRLKALAQERQVPLDTLRLKAVIERFLARLFRSPNPSWLLKGGFALELRYRPRARTTRDVDLTAGAAVVPANREGLAEALREMLQDAAEADLGDFLVFHVGVAQAVLAGAPLGGARFPCQAVLDGKTYARFHVDVGCGDAVVDAPDPLTGEGLLEFAGIPPARVLAISCPQQFAEKVHAYTFPWTGRTNTRTKDLVDLVLLIETGPPDTERLVATLRATFSTRATHPLPETLPPPPEAWHADFALMAAEARLSTNDYLAGFAILERFWAERRLGG
jgi:Nucleotidyl transferase AbiEii toxin, Type IV TA system